MSENTAETNLSKFNLLTEPWITVLDQQGMERDISIHEALENGKAYQRLADPLETTNFVILRILLAILYRAWDADDLNDEDAALELWQSLWEAPTLLSDEVKAYLDEWSYRFNLRDPEYPFFQVPDLHTSKDSVGDIALLIPDVGALFSMRTEVTELTAAEAARALVHCQAYDFSGIKSGAVGDDRVKGGRGYPIGIGWAGWLGGTVLHGDNLKETLLLNFAPQHGPELAGHSGDDLPIWELPQLTSSARKEPRFDPKSPERTRATGPVELLTWPQRRIRLFWEDNKAIGVLISNGDPVGYTRQYGVEKMTPWRYSDPQSKKAKTLVYMPREFEPGRALWRSLSGILPLTRTQQAKSKFGANGTVDASKPPKTVEWLSTLLLDGQAGIDESKRIRVSTVSMSYGSQSSSYGTIATDSLSIGTALLAPEQEDLREAARSGVELSDQVAWETGNFYRKLVFAGSGEFPSDADDIRSRFYAAIDVPFREWLLTLTPSVAPSTAIDVWQKTLRTTAERVGRDLLDDVSPQAWAGRWHADSKFRITAGSAHLQFRRNLTKILGQVNPVDRNNEKEGSS